MTLALSDIPHPDRYRVSWLVALAPNVTSGTGTGSASVSVSVAGAAQILPVMSASQFLRQVSGLDL